MFTVSVAIVAECKSCKRRYDLTNLRDVTDVDAEFRVDCELEGCPGCSPVGGPDDGESVAAE